MAITTSITSIPLLCSGHNWGTVPLKIIKENPHSVTDSFTYKHIHLVATSHLKVGCTLYNASLCCDYATVSPTPNWQALSAGSILETGFGGHMCESWSGAGCEITAVTSVQRVHKTGSSALSMDSTARPSLVVGACHPQRPRSAAPSLTADLSALPPIRFIQSVRAGLVGSRQCSRRWKLQLFVNVAPVSKCQAWGHSLCSWAVS